MVNPLPAYAELKDVASRDFLIGAFFPWIFVIVADVAIYELFVPDGVSLVDRFLSLEENDQLYAAIAIVIGLAGLAAASDFLADGIMGWYRRQSWTRERSGKAEWHENSSFEQQFARMEVKLTSEQTGILMPRINASQAAIKRSGIFIIGFGLSIIFNTGEMSVYQPDPLVSAWLLLTLWTFMAVPLFLIHKQFKQLCDYDKLLIAWADEFDG